MGIPLKETKIGFIPATRGSFSIELAAKVRGQALETPAALATASKLTDRPSRLRRSIASCAAASAASWRRALALARK